MNICEVEFVNDQGLVDEVVQLVVLQRLLFVPETESQSSHNIRQQQLPYF